jgi:acyl-lipid omega-6 desaturase (Delta-12 desaturase)
MPDVLTAERGSAETSAPRANPRAWWVAPLEPYAGADLRRSIVCLGTSVVPYLALCVAMYYLITDVSIFLALLVAIPASGFLLRTFIVFHDCTHGSFMPSKRANTWVGVFVGLVVYSPFHSWRQEHAGHHATSGDLDRRGVGDVQTLTVAEYNARPARSRLAYRLMRNPWIMFTIGPIWSLALNPRRIPKHKRERLQNSHRNTNFGLLVLIISFAWLIGPLTFLEIQVPLVAMAGTAGVWLFYVQHQFEGVYWKRSEDWNYADAALEGSSYLKMHPILQFFTGYIGLHHVHHLNPRIPNYNLQKAHDENEFLHRAPVISLWDGLRCVKLKLIDEDAGGRLVSFADARRPALPSTS